MFEIHLDVDGVLADTHRHVAEILCLAPAMAIPTKFEVEDWLPPDQSAQARDLMSRPEFWLTLPVMQGAQDGVQKLRDRNCDITILTSPYKSCPMWYEARIDWLRSNFNFKQDDLIVGKKKWKCGSVDRFIDDSYENIVLFEQKNPNARAFLFDAPYNLSHTRTQRLTWDTIDRIF